MPNQCIICQREFKAAAGLGAHMRTHKGTTLTVEHIQAAKKVLEANEVPEPRLPEQFVEISRSGDFALAVCGDMAVLTDLTGKRLSRPMHIDKMTSVFQRMSSSRR